MQQFGILRPPLFAVFAQMEAELLQDATTVHVGLRGAKVVSLKAPGGLETVLKIKADEFLSLTTGPVTLAA